MPRRRCLECDTTLEGDASVCPGCGARQPRGGPGAGTGFEWRTRASLLGLPLIHVSLGWDAAGRVRVARGIVAIGQFAVGVVTLGQFGVGLLTVGQVGVGLAVALGQFVVGAVAVAQFGLCLVGWGPYVATPLGAAPVAVVVAETRHVDAAASVGPVWPTPRPGDTRLEVAPVVARDGSDRTSVPQSRITHAPGRGQAQWMTGGVDQ